MADYKIGLNNHSTQSSKDAFSVSASLTRTPAFQRMASNPLAKDAFIKTLESKKEAALAKNDTSMFTLIGSMINAAKAEQQQVKQSAHKFDSNDYLFA